MVHTVWFIQYGPYSMNNKYILKYIKNVDPALATMAVHSSIIAILGTVYSLFVWIGIPELQVSKNVHSDESEHLDTTTIYNILP